jgi:hypothetical protein
MTDEPIRTFDQALLSAWQEQLKATHSPIAKEQGLQQAHYQQLKALRRRVRPSRDRSASQRALPLSGICSWAFNGIYRTAQATHNG